MFDYGGTIDACGDHWSEIIYDGYKAVGLDIPKHDFRDAYVEAERKLARERIIMPSHNFLDLMLIKIAIETDWLNAHGYQIERPVSDAIARYCYDRARATVESVRPVLDLLHARYPMALISNFYGNIESVLLDFGLREYFRSIVESAVIGVRKPDPRIFAIGAMALGMPADEILVVGDSYRKDIKPALSLGCPAVWIKGRPWMDGEEANEDGVPEVGSLQELPACLPGL